jgi:hypothetical protein
MLRQNTSLETNDARKESFFSHALINFETFLILAFGFNV